jgi:hypothetical protein
MRCIVKVHAIPQKKCLVGIATILLLLNVWSRQYIMSKNQHGFRTLKPNTRIVEVHTILQKKCLVCIATVLFLLNVWSRQYIMSKNQHGFRKLKPFFSVSSGQGEAPQLLLILLLSLLKGTVKKCRRVI